MNNLTAGTGTPYWYEWSAVIFDGQTPSASCYMVYFPVIRRKYCLTFRIQTVRYGRRRRPIC